MQRGEEGWFETHAHLSDAKFDSDRDQVIERAFSAGIGAIVEIADGPTEWPKAKQLAERYSGKLWWAAGLHPYYADQSAPPLWRELKGLTQHPQFVAIGEIGLDYAKCPIPQDVQKEAFINGIELALQTHKPMIIHCREAYTDLMPLLRSYISNASNPGVIHCFSGNRENAEELIHMGFYLGVDGPLTYPSATALREALQTIPNDKLVLETDSPYLPPQTHRGQRNEPSLLPEIGNHLAWLRNISPKEMTKITYLNSKKLFRLNPLE
ncbi:MAG: putative metal-dependent hydrolase YcfH [Elusimicrobia bacterium]|nr:putative metal-dependent hydrolase YcfH [Elusimicrobiota bacterium]